MGECLILKSGGGIDTSNATATSDKILQGYTAYVNNVLVHGSMKDQGSVNATIQAGTYYTIPEGYHSGYGWVKAEGLTDQTSGTATADKILSKYTAWVNGVKLTGSMTDRGSLTYQLPVNGNYYIPFGYHNGNGRVYQSLSTQGETTITPGTSSKIACASGKYTTGTIWVAGDTNLMGENIKKGVSIFGVSGTSSGYITTNIEIYNRGKNPYGLYVDETYVGYYEFYDYMIQIRPYYNGEIPFHIRQSINISGYNGCVFSCASSVEHQPVKISIIDDTSGLQIGNRGVSGTGKNDVNDLYVEIQATERLPGTLTFNITLPGANSYITRILFV